MGKQSLELKRSIDRRPISSNSGYNSNPFFFLLFKSVFLDNFPVIFRVSYHQIADKKNQSELAFYAFIFESHFAIALGFLHPGLNNPA